MPRGETLRKFLASLMLHGFYGSAIMRMEAGKVMHVETEKRRIWQYKDLPQEVSEPWFRPSGQAPPYLESSIDDGPVRQLDVQLWRKKSEIGGTR